MNGINRVFILGYLGAAPEEMKSKTGKVYVRMSVATHYSRKLESGERESSTTWHRVTVWGKNAERCRTRLVAGSPLAVEGYISKYTYEKSDGSDAAGFSIVAREIHFVGGGKTTARSEGSLTESARDLARDLIRDSGADSSLAPSARTRLVEAVQAHS